MASRSRRYLIDNGNATERFLNCSPKMRDGQQMVTRDGVPMWTVQTLEDVQRGDYSTTDDKQEVVLIAPRPVDFPKYSEVKWVNPELSEYGFRTERGEVVHGVTVFVTDIVEA